MKPDTLRSVLLFSELDDEAARELCALLSIRKIPAGTSLFRRGDPGDSMFLVEKGCVRISAKDAEGNESMLAEMGAGEFFGEMAMVDGQTRSANATAMRDTQLAVLSGRDFRAFVRKKPEIALEMLMTLTHRLRLTDNLLSHRIARNVNEEVAAHLTYADRAADALAEFGGSWKFIGASLAFSFFWVGLNSWLLFNKGFDPYPYVLLNLIIGMIASLSAPVIMMSQNRQAQKDRLRADLDYRVNLKNEILLTEVLHRLESFEAIPSPEALPNEPKSPRSNH